MASCCLLVFFHLKKQMILCSNEQRNSFSLISCLLKHDLILLPFYKRGKLFRKFSQGNRRNKQGQNERTPNSQIFLT